MQKKQTTQLEVPRPQLGGEEKEGSLTSQGSEMRLDSTQVFAPLVDAFTLCATCSSITRVDGVVFPH